jgi:hypothetical protein
MSVDLGRFGEDGAAVSGELALGAQQRADA